MRGTDKAVWEKDYNGFGGVWSSWTSRGGVILGDPAGVAANYPGTRYEEVFARGTDNQLWYKILVPPPGTQRWAKVAGLSLTSSPAAAGLQYLDGPEDDVSVFALGTGTTIWQVRYHGGAWSAWYPVP